MELSIQCNHCGMFSTMEIISLNYNAPDCYCLITYRCPECGFQGQYKLMS